jgi:hypothetical protein
MVAAAVFAALALSAFEPEPQAESAAAETANAQKRRIDL